MVVLFDYVQFSLSKFIVPIVFHCSPPFLNDRTMGFPKINKRTLLVVLKERLRRMDPHLDDVTDDVSDCVIYCVIFCSNVRYCSSRMYGMHCARSRDMCHALLRNSDVII